MCYHRSIFRQTHNKQEGGGTTIGIFKPDLDSLHVMPPGLFELDKNRVGNEEEILKVPVNPSTFCSRFVISHLQKQKDKKLI